MNDPFSIWDDTDNIWSWDERSFLCDTADFRYRVDKAKLLPMDSIDDIENVHERAKTLKHQLDILSDGLRHRNIPPYRESSVHTVIQGLSKEVMTLLFKSHQAVLEFVVKPENE